jgi:uncharacterized protein (TIGR03118 family)
MSSPSPRARRLLLPVAKPDHGSRLRLDDLECRLTPATVALPTFTQTNLVSDLAGMAKTTDPNLVNPWGMALGSAGRIWVADNGTGKATVYDATGLPTPAGAPTVVTIPGPGGTGASAPTGAVTNTTSGFRIAAGGQMVPSTELFATEDGTIAAWNSAADSANAVIVVDNSAAGAVYKGLAETSDGSGTFLFATNFHAGTVDTFDTNFKAVQTSGGFHDENLPAGYAPFGITAINGRLFVSYALQNAAKHDDVAGAGHGFIDVFDTKGHLMGRLTSRGPLNSPWGMVLTPSTGFGAFDDSILVGNFGDGTINAFSADTGQSLGPVTDAGGKPITIQNLWGLQFGPAPASDTLFFAAGIQDEQHGLFGTLTVNPGGTNTPPTISEIRDTVTVPPGHGEVTVTFTVGDRETPADQLTVTSASSNTTLLPAGSLALGGSGAERTLTITPAAGQIGDATVTLTVTDTGGLTATDSFTVHVPPANGKHGLVGHKHFVTGGDEGSGNVTLHNDDDSVAFSATPFPGFTGGVRTAVADLDGGDDVVAGTGPGVPTRVVVLSGTDQHQMFSMNPFEAAFTGGVFVTSADVNGDGVDDLVITPDEGGGPRVLIVDGKTGAVIADFFGIADPDFRGGARASLADVNGDGVPDLIVAAGFGGGPRVAVFDGTTLTSGNPVRLFNDFFAFESTLRNGVFVTAGDLDGDGFADLIFGGGPGGGPRVLALSGKNMLSTGGATQTVLANFFAGDPNTRDGVHVAAADLDGDNLADLVVGPGQGAGGMVTAFLGKTLTPSGTPPTDFNFDGGTNGVFVG